MNVLIVGCGREGSEVARSMAAQGHAVTVIDTDATRFDQLGPSFPGRTVQGFSFDRGALERATTASCHRRASYRSTFRTVGDVPMAMVGDEITYLHNDYRRRDAPHHRVAREPVDRGSASSPRCRRGSANCGS